MDTASMGWEGLNHDFWFINISLRSLNKSLAGHGNPDLDCHCLSVNVQIDSLIKSHTATLEASV